MTFRTFLSVFLVCACAIGSNSRPFASGAHAQESDTRRPDVVMIHVAYANDLDGIRGGDLPARDLPARHADAGVCVSVSRAADLVGNPSQAMREDFGENSVASSYSDHPVVRVGVIEGAGITNAPLDGLRVTSRFGSRRHPVDGVDRLHAGIDYGAAYGTQIMATGAAIVTFAGAAGGYGLLVKLDHGAGLETRYAHMSRITVSVGERVSAGQVIGYVGSTGSSTGAHLHYETRVNGRAVDPLDR